MIEPKTSEPFTENAGTLSDDQLIALTRRGVARVSKISPFFERCPPREVPDFDEDEYCLGSILGNGEFGVVREISYFTIYPGEFCVCEACKRQRRLQQDGATNSHRLIDGSMNARRTVSVDNEKQYMKHHISHTGNRRYAIKTLKAEVTKGDFSPEALYTASLDLALEAKFLAALSHPNIIKLRGIVGTPGSRSFAIVLDCLYLTLDRAIQTWKQVEVKTLGEKIRSRVSWSFSKSSDALTVSQCERLGALSDVARALRYLHANNIVYRDLKPHNIGQDVRGDFRMFDFGLAKELKFEDKGCEDGEYKLTGLVGTRRYMAPEVVLCRDYGKAIDVYSFGLLFWQVCSLKEPFAKLTQSKHTANVVVKGQRPSLKRVSWLPASLKTLMKQCWSRDPKVRPSMVDVCDCLRKQLETSSLDYQDFDKSSVSWLGSPEDS